MSNKNAVYYCEGEDELKLIEALQIAPNLILPGKPKKINVIQNLIPKSILLGIKPGTTITLVFDTDVVSNMNTIRKNIENINKYCKGISIVCLLQVENLEDELVRSTDVKSVLELTKSKSVN